MKKRTRILSMLLAAMMLLAVALSGAGIAAAATTITNASVTVTPPKAGDTSTGTPSKGCLTPASGSHFIVEASCWFHENQTWSEVSDLEKFTFKAGSTYKFWMTLKADSGYQFSDSATAEIKGGKLEEIEDIYTYGDYSAMVIIASVTIGSSEPETCKITFKANGGSGSMAAVTVEKGTSYKLPECGFKAPSGKEFDKWDKGAPGEKIKITSDTVIKALWKNKAPESFSLTFNANGGTGTMKAITGEKGKSFTLPKNVFTKKDCIFKAWNTKKNGSGTSYADGAKISLTKNLTLYAQWAKISLKIKKPTIKASAKKLQLQVTLKIDGKPVKGKKVTVVFNGKKYTKKTDSKGIAKVTIKKSVLKKLKPGSKVTIEATYENTTVKKSVKVKK